MIERDSTPLNSVNPSTDATVWMGYGKWKMKLLSSDMYPYYETFIAGQYNSLEIRKSDRVLDAGASVGDFSLLASEAVGAQGRVVSLEPDPHYYSILNENLRMNMVNNCTPMLLALSDETGKGLASLNNLESSRQIEASTITMSDLLKQTRLSHFDVVKLDIEGAEENVFRETSWLADVRDLVVETHGKAFDPVVSSLERDGFQVSIYNMREMLTNTIRFAFRHPFDFAIAEKSSRALALRTAVRSLSHPARGPKIVSGSYSPLHIVHGKRIQQKS